MTKQTVACLAQVEGLSHEESALRFQDNDLWILPPASRWVVADPEEAVKEWEQAVVQLEALAEAAICGLCINESAVMVIRDAAERAYEMLDRSRERLRQG